LKSRPPLPPLGSCGATLYIRYTIPPIKLVKRLPLTDNLQSKFKGTLCSADGQSIPAGCSIYILKLFKKKKGKEGRTDRHATLQGLHTRTTGWQVIEHFISPILVFLPRMGTRTIELQLRALESSPSKLLCIFLFTRPPQGSAESQYYYFSSVAIPTIHPKQRIPEISA